MFPLSADGDRVDECRTFGTVPHHPARGHGSPAFFLFSCMCLGIHPGVPATARRLLIISHASGYGGAERSIELLAPELARHVRVVVLTGNARHRHNLTTNAARAGVHLRVFPLPLDDDDLSRLSEALRVLAFAWLFRPDAILTNTERSAEVLARVARIYPRIARKSWVYVRDFLWRNLPGSLARLTGAGVLVPGPAVLEREGYLAPWVEPSTRRPVHVVPDMVAELPEIPPLPETPRHLAVLHLATVNPWKGHIHLIRAAALLRDQGRPLWIRSRGVTGDDSLRRDLERQIAEAGLGGPGNLELLPHAEDPTDELLACACVVVTSVSQAGGPETFGRSIIEAWAYGRPVVAFEAGGARHLITHEVDGLLVPEGDPQALADALWRVQTEPGLAARLGTQGREKVRSQYLIHPIADQLLSLLNL